MSSRSASSDLPSGGAGSTGTLSGSAGSESGSGGGTAPGNAATGTAESGRSAEGGLTFVEMMFAVALGDTANQVAKVMKTVRESPEPILDGLWAVSPSLAHLTLVIFVIATSWVGWYHSSATRDYMQKLKPVFAPTFPSLLAFPFMMLLIDVFLVVCYFILSEGVEVPSYDTQQGVFVLTASTKPEIDWIVVILVTYLAWNVLFMFHAWWFAVKPIPGSKRAARIITAVVSILLALGAWWTCRGVAEREAVLMVDGALLAAILTFRLRGVDDAGKLQWWDVVRGLALVAVAGALILSAA